MTGEGQAIEVPMFETMTQFVLADHMGGGAFSPPLGELGYKRLLPLCARTSISAEREVGI